MLKVSAEDRVGLIDEWEEIIVELVQEKQIDVGNQPLDAAYFWIGANGEPTSMTLIYRPKFRVNDHRKTTWLHIMLDGTDRIMPTHNQHHLFNKLRTSDKVETHWFGLTDTWLLLTSGTL